MTSAHLAIDLGASSGRAMLGFLDGDNRRLQLDEVHRFEHQACPTPTGPVWDLTGIWREILSGLRAAVERCRQRDVDLTSIGVDSWGVDWALIGHGGELLFLPHCYRDPRNESACQDALNLLGGAEKLYQRTGIQLMPLNTLFQLHAAKCAEPRAFDAAKRLLFLPDLFHYWLSGEMTVERSIASTSSFLAVDSGEWDRELVERLGVSGDLLGPLVDPGAQIGVLRTPLAEETGAPRGLRVVAPAGHDTASAIAATPTLEPTGWAYLSCGTWSLLGVERSQPLATPAAEQATFTNERGVERKICLLKNIPGLWLVQELRRELAASGKKYSFAELDALAAEASSTRTVFDVNDPRLSAPGAVISKLAEVARASGQPAPETIGQAVRCCHESLAHCYRTTVEQLANLTGAPVNKVHLMGGGCNSRMLCQLTADAIDGEVYRGPVEATAIGNALIQAMGCGLAINLTEIRQIVLNSFPIERIEKSSPRA